MTTTIAVELTDNLSAALDAASEDLEEDPEELIRCALETWLAKPQFPFLDQWTPAGVQRFT